jgi:hypothetical protein
MEKFEIELVEEELKKAHTIFMEEGYNRVMNFQSFVYWATSVGFIKTPPKPEPAKDQLRLSL